MFLNIFRRAEGLLHLYISLSFFVSPQMPYCPLLHHHHHLLLLLKHVHHKNVQRCEELTENHPFKMRNLSSQSASNIQ
jgi:hypothetical protein